MHTNKHQTARPVIIGLGGTTAAGSATEKALGLALASAGAAGAVTTRLLGAQCLARLPLFTTVGVEESPEACELLRSIRQADGLIIASPGYHGTVSGLVKNALDYIEATAKDERPYLSDLPVGIITIAGGHQAAVGTLTTLRAIVHALRGYPTPFGAALCPSGPLFAGNECQDPIARAHIARVGAQVGQFARMRLREVTPLVAA